MKQHQPAPASLSFGPNLELVPDSDLHRTRRALDSGEVRPDNRRSPGRLNARSPVATNWCSCRIQTNSVTKPATQDRAHPLSVGNVERVKVEFQLLFLAPGHRELLGKARVKHHVTGKSERV